MILFKNIISRDYLSVIRVESIVIPSYMDGMYLDPVSLP